MNPRPCRWCRQSRGEVMVATIATDVWICPTCDYVEKYQAGPPIAAERIRPVDGLPVAFCNWCLDPDHPDPARHPGGQARHEAGTA